MNSGCGIHEGCDSRLSVTQHPLSEQAVNPPKVKVTICYFPLCSVACRFRQHRIISGMGTASESIARISLIPC
jgi:hypothetical protein